MPQAVSPPPYVRLSLFYFTYFAALGVFVPYWPVYLHNVLGLSAVQIGVLMAVFMASKVVAPLLWGWLADHTGQRLRMVRLASLFTVLCFAGVYWQDGFGWLLGVMAAFGFFWNAPLPQFEALTLNHLGSQVGRYSWIRLWGSVGFIVTVLGMPPMLGWAGLAAIPHALLLLFAGIWLSTWLVRDKPHPAHAATHGRLREALRVPAVWALLLACALQQASHGVYYNFFSLYLDGLGYGSQMVGGMWALGVAVEVVLFLFMHRLLARYRAESLFVLALFLTACRWVLLAYWADHLPFLLLAQTLHAATYGLFHASAIHVVHHWFPGRLQGRGQALYSGASYGLGGALGSVASGYAWQAWGATSTFMAAAGLAVLALLLAWVWVRQQGGFDGTGR